MTYEEWLKTVPIMITTDALWRMQAYRLAEFLAYQAFDDSDLIAKKPHRISLADQLYRAVTSISANVCEGYSCPTDKEQARFYSYALRSARESRSWYFKATRILGEEMAYERMVLLESIIRLLIRMVTAHRGKGIREAVTDYDVEG